MKCRKHVTDPVRPVKEMQLNDATKMNSQPKKDARKGRSSCFLPGECEDEKEGGREGEKKEREERR